jgi:hypothetical protein
MINCAGSASASEPPSRAHFKLAGYEGELLVASIASEDDRAFLLEPAAFSALGERGP